MARQCAECSHCTVWSGFLSLSLFPFLPKGPFDPTSIASLCGRSPRQTLRLPDPPCSSPTCRVCSTHHCLQVSALLFPLLTNTFLLHSLSLFFPVQQCTLLTTQRCPNVSNGVELKCKPKISSASWQKRNTTAHSQESRLQIRYQCVRVEYWSWTSSC